MPQKKYFYKVASILTDPPQPMAKQFQVKDQTNPHQIMSLFTGKAKTYLIFLLSVAGALKVSAQSASLSLKEALERVQAHLPQLEAFREQSAATSQNIALAKNTLVPDLTVGYQVNAASFNNITGMSYPGFLVPISGPPSPTNNMNIVPGSAAGALVKWSPFTFGQRAAAIEKATAQFKQANASYNEQLFRYQYSAVNVYLEAVYYQQLLRSLRASVQRNNAGLEQSLVLARNGLRPGIDTAQFQSAIAQSEIDLLQAERFYREELITLGGLTALDSVSGNIILTDTLFSVPGVPVNDTASFIPSHPLYQTLEAQKSITAAALKEVQKSWMPQLDIWGNAYARGSGVDAAGHINKADGFNLSRTNVGIGLQLSFPVLQYAKMNIKKKQYLSLLKADEARLAQAQLDISRQMAAAMEQYRFDIKIAAKSPLLLKAATDVYEGLKLSYETGLTDYNALAQSQYELSKAEVNDANARLQLWRSLLAVAVAKGNLNLFTDQLK